MKRLVFKVLEYKFKNRELRRTIYDLDDCRVEVFINKNGTKIMEYRKFHNGKEDRGRVNSIVKRDIKSFFVLEDSIIERYVLDWCREKTCK